MINFDELRISNNATTVTPAKWNGVVDKVETFPHNLSPAKLELINTGSKLVVEAKERHSSVESKGPLVINFNKEFVGIGTTVPSAKLHVRGKGAMNVDLQVNGRIRSNNKDGGLWVHHDRFVGGVHTNQIGFYNARAWRLLVRNNGFVGIGTNVKAASQQLHVVGNRIRLQKPGKAKFLDMRTDGGANDISSYGADLYLNANSSTRKVADKYVVISSMLKLKKMPYGNFKNVQWNSKTQVLGYDNSSMRFKENITNLSEDFESILNVVPKTYTRPGDEERWEIGFLAEDFHKLGLKPLVDYDEEGLPEGLRYDKMVTYLIPIIAKQKKQIDELRKALKEVTN